jgi:hypothetical protein
VHDVGRAKRGRGGERVSAPGRRARAIASAARRARSWAESTVRPAVSSTSRTCSASSWRRARARVVAPTRASISCSRARMLTLPAALWRISSTVRRRSCSKDVPRAITRTRPSTARTGVSTRRSATRTSSAPSQSTQVTAVVVSLTPGESALSAMSTICRTPKAAS